MGRGWSIDTGSSRIRRCGSTVAEDGIARPVKLDKGDHLCLEDERLILVSGGGYWDAGAEYRTANDQYARITRHPSGASGPSFEVKSSKGEVRRYGATPQCNGCGTIVWGNDHIEEAWLLSEVEDRWGNLIEYSYDQSLNPRSNETPNGTESEGYRPGTVWYTSNRSEGLDATRRIDFFYAARTDRHYGRRLGGRRTSDWALERIEVSAASPILSTTGPAIVYEMEYETAAPSHLMRLASVRECDGAGVCQAPTSFGYQDGAAGFEEPITIAGPAPIVENTGWGYEPLAPYVLDANGDGRDDIAYPRDGSWRLRLAQGGAMQGSPFEAEVDIQHLAAGEVSPAMVMDFDADGFDDLLLFEDGPTQGTPQEDATWRILLSNGDGTFTLHDTGARLPRLGWNSAWGPPTSAVPHEPYRASWLQSHTIPVDFNADGYPDLVSYDLEVGQSLSQSELWFIRFNDTQGGFGAPVSLTDLGASEYPHLVPFAIDIEGDGAAELMMPDPCNCGMGIMAYDGSGPTQYSQSISLGASLERSEQLKFANFNGDGLWDVAFYEPNVMGSNSANLDLFVNTGAGFEGIGGASAIGYLGVDDWSMSWHMAMAMTVDYDRDGVGDLLAPRLAWDPASAPSTWGVLRAQTGEDYLSASGFDGNADGTPDAYFEPIELLDIPYDPYGACEGQTGDSNPTELEYAYPRPRLMDVNGDTLLDLVQIECGELVVRLAAGVRDGLLTEVWEGSDGPSVPGEPARYAVEYAAPSDPSVYTKGDYCPYPQKCEVPDKSLVSALRVDNGSAGGPNRYAYAYEDWRVDLLGHGPLGFGAMTVRENAINRVSRSEFANHWRHNATGRYPRSARLRARDTTTTLDSGAIIEETLSKLDHVVETWPGVLAVETEQRTESLRELQAGSSVQLGWSRTEYDPPSRYGTIQRETTTTMTGTRSVERELADNVPDWIVGVVAFESVRDTDSEGNSFISERSYAHDMSTGELHGITENPNRPLDRRTTTLVRNDVGLVERSEVTDASGDRRTLDVRYDDQQIHTVYIRNSEGHEQHALVDGVWGIPTVSSDANGLITTQQIDTFGQVVQVKYPSGQTVATQRAFPNAGSNYAWSVRSSSPGHFDGTEYFDRVGHVVARASTGLLGKISVLDMVYDAQGTLEQASEPHAPGVTASHWTTWEHDKIGRVRRIAYPDLTERGLEYDGLEVIETNPRGEITSRLYDTQGNLDSVRDPNGAWTAYRYGPRGVLTLIHDDDGNKTHVEYDDLGRRTRLVDPDLGERRWEYGGFGDISGAWSPQHGWRTFDVDGLGRVVGIADIDGATRFDFDIFGTQGTLGRHESPDGIVVDSGYDVATGLPDQWVLRMPGEAPLVMSAEYDAVGRPRALHYPSPNGVPFSVEYAYDDVGNIVRVFDPASGKDYWSVDEADLRGHATKESFGNGVTATRSYAAATGRLVGLGARRAGSSSDDIVSLRYGYDANWNLRFRHDDLQNGGGGLAEAFAYDALDRVGHVRLCEGGPPSPSTGLVPDDFDAGCNETDFIEYDALGNILHRSTIGTYAYKGAQPHAVTSVDGVTYGYDANGNLASRGAVGLQYSAFDLPRRFYDTSTGAQTDLEYDGFQQRTRKRTSTLESVYFDRFYRRDDQPNAPWGNPNATHRFFVFGGDHLVAEVVREPSSSNVKYLHRDRLGSVVAETDDGAGGSITVDRHDYDVFGAPRNPDWSAPGAVPMSTDAAVGYGGHELDPELDLVNMGGRLFDPRIGRFTTPDPYVQAPWSLQSLNRYSYVVNNPMSLVDPTGFQAAEDYDGRDGLDWTGHADGDGAYIEVHLPGPQPEPEPAPPEPEPESDEVGGDDEPDAPERTLDAGEGDRPGWGTRFATTLADNFVTTNRVARKTATKQLAKLTAAAVATTIGGVTVGEAARGLLFPTARTWGQVARGMFGIAPKGFALGGANGVGILRGAGIPARGAGYLTASGTVASAAITYAVNAVLVTVALEAGIAVGSAFDAGLQASGVDLSVSAPEAWGTWSDFVTVVE